MPYASARTVTDGEIPVIDIGPLRDGSGLEEAGRRLAWAAEHVGFIYVENHGIEQSLVDDARQVAVEFFRHADEKKLEVVTNEHHHGYLRPGQTKMYDDARVDLKESFNFGIELEAAVLTAAKDNPLIGRNEWPSFMPELKQKVYAYFAAASACAVDLLRGFAAGAGLPADTFVRHTDLPVSRGSLQYYPPQPAELGVEQFGVAAHTDFGVLTVLCQDSLGGLQLQTLDGEWIAVPPIPGTLVVNVGDLLARWSNNRYRSTPHRVINASGKERLSLVLAYDPNYESWVDPIIFCGAGETPTYEAISCGDYLMWRFEKAFAYRKQSNESGA